MKVVFFQNKEGESDVVAWLATLKKQKPKVFVKLETRIERLAELGNALRRPEADYLRDGIYELRARCQNVNYRLLYFFNGTTVAVIASGLTKEQEVPAGDIDEAVSRKVLFSKDPAGHTVPG